MADKNFFNPYSLVKQSSKGGSGQDYINQLKKAKEAEKRKKMDEEISDKPSQGFFSQTAQRKKSAAEMNPHLGEQSAFRISRKIKGFLAQRKIFKDTMKELQGKISSYEVILGKAQAVRNVQFLKDDKLIELLGLAGIMWLSGMKKLQVIKLKKNTLNLKTQALTLIGRLNELVYLSFDRQGTKPSLFTYLMNGQPSGMSPEGSGNEVSLLKKLLTLNSYLTILVAIDGSIDYINSKVVKSSILRIYISIFDTEEVVFRGRLLQLQGDALQVAKTILTEFFEKKGMTKVLASHLQQYLKTIPEENPFFVKSLILAIFFRYFFTKTIQKFDPSIISPKEQSDEIMLACEASLSAPLSAIHFVNEILESPKLGSVFYDILDNMPSNIPISTTPALNSDSKINLTISMIYILTAVLPKKDLPESTLRSLGEFLDVNADTYLTKKFFGMVVMSFSGDKQMSYINSALTRIFHSNSINAALDLILTQRRRQVIDRL